MVSEETRRGGALLVARRHLGSAVRADLGEVGEIVSLDWHEVVAAAIRAVSDELPISPPFRSGDMPDVLLGPLEPKRRLGAKLFGHRI
jgi:hypothetical protein